MAKTSAKANNIINAGRLKASGLLRKMLPIKDDRLPVIKTNLTTKLIFNPFSIYPLAMSELEDEWEILIARAKEAAGQSGRSDVHDYLSLRSSNDAIRRTAVNWLISEVIAVSSESVRNGHAVRIERFDPHNFSAFKANMVGTRLEVRRGVRCLAVEAGWTRTPKDGFMRGGALAFARITHLGMPKSNEELGLYRIGNTVDWAFVEDEKAAMPFTSADIVRHFMIFHGK